MTELRKAEFLSEGAGSKAVFRHAPGPTEGTFDSSGFSTNGTFDSLNFQPMEP